MTKIAVIDADLIGRKRHRFPNLSCMKISGYHKEQGHEVKLKLDYDGLQAFDKVYIAKVFTDTEIPPDVLKLENVKCGGTGFFYDRAIPLPDEIEHHMPDYHLYDDWVAKRLLEGRRPAELRYYTDYSIGFTTRGCFRKCAFCVNKNSDRVKLHSPLAEFLDKFRSKICLLDDNVFGYPGWKAVFDELKESGLKFQFKQGLDIRLLDDEKAEALFRSKYDGDFIFAFDNIEDMDLIENRLQLAREYTDAAMKFYCFCGFDRRGFWDGQFWEEDIFDLLRRIELLMKYRCLPYVMRFNRYVESPYRRLFVTIARWCNQPRFFKKVSLRQFGEMNGKGSAAMNAIAEFENRFAEAGRYLNLVFPSKNF